MKTHVQKWGNSFAVRLPISIIEALNLYPGCLVELKLHDKFIKIEKYSDNLDDLLSLINSQNIHSIQFEDSNQGQEQW